MSGHEGHGHAPGEGHGAEEKKAPNVWELDVFASLMADNFIEGTELEVRLCV